MEAIRLTTDWNADPNSPDVKLSVDGNNVTLDFFLNYFVYDNFQEGDKAQLTFINCHKYSFNTMNDEGYYRGQYRYKHNELPWGEFYILISNWGADFPLSPTFLNQDKNRALKHYVFFFKDNTFECVAENYELVFKKSQL